MSTASTSGGSGGVYNVRYYGAHGDGAALDTAAIQAAIDACHAANGGVVLFPAGSYMTGTLYLRSQVTLHLNARATLLGSTDIADYATDTEGIRYEGEGYMDRCLLFARDCRQIGISGEGTIDGQGGLDHFPNPESRERPMLLRLVGCSQVHLRDVTLRDPAAWTTAFIACRDVRVEGLTIDSRANYNGDGLDFDGCQNVFVSRCRISSSDDCICLQTSERDRPCQNVVISDCVLSSEWAGLRIGLLSCGDLRNVTVSNCIFHDIKGSGIKVQMNEGGVLEDMLFANLVMDNVPRPIFCTFNSFRVRRDAGPQLPPMQALRHLQFRGIRASAGADSAQSYKSFIAFVGLPANPIEDVTLSDIHFTAPGGGTRSQGARRDVPELIGKRPEHSELGETLPAYGLYARHVKGLVLDNITLDYLRPELRPAIVCDDVQGLELVGVRALGHAAGEALVRLQDVRGAMLRGCRCLSKVKAFVSAEGKCRDIALVANDLRLAGKAVKRGPDVGKKQVLRQGNLEE
jgi:hypothetical protein